MAVVAIEVYLYIASPSTTLLVLFLSSSASLASVRAIRSGGRPRKSDPSAAGLTLLTDFSLRETEEAQSFSFFFVGVPADLGDLGLSSSVSLEEEEDSMSSESSPGVGGRDLSVCRVLVVGEVGLIG